MVDKTKMIVYKYCEKIIQYSLLEKINFVHDTNQTRLKRLSGLKGCLTMIKMKFVCMLIDKICTAIKET